MFLLESYLQTFPLSEEVFRRRRKTDHLSYIFEFEGARQASSTSLCAFLRAVPWADVGEQQLSRLALSACDLSADVRILEQGCWRPLAQTPKTTFEVWGGKTSKQPQSLCLRASSAMGRWGWPTAFQASSFWLRSICRSSHSQSRAAAGHRHEPRQILL